MAKDGNTHLRCCRSLGRRSSVAASAASTTRGAGWGFRQCQVAIPVWSGTAALDIVAGADIVAFVADLGLGRRGRGNI